MIENIILIGSTIVLTCIFALLGRIVGVANATHKHNQIKRKIAFDILNKRRSK